jgi:hypothetical protein
LIRKIARVAGKIPSGGFTVQNDVRDKRRAESESQYRDASRRLQVLKLPRQITLRLSVSREQAAIQWARWMLRSPAPSAAKRFTYKDLSKFLQTRYDVKVAPGTIHNLRQGALGTRQREQAAVRTATDNGEHTPAQGRGAPHWGMLPASAILMGIDYH